MVAGAIANAVKNKKKKSQEKTKDKPSFSTPARFGWGKVARELHPRQTKVVNKMS